jgi:hypothetical protein
MSEKSDKEFVKAVDSFRNLKVVKLEQQNEALLAQVDAVYDGLSSLADQLVEEIQQRQEKTGRRQIGKEGALRRVNRLLATFNSDIDKPLDSLKSRIEDETISRCAEKVAVYYGKGAGSMALADMSRKYQTTELLEK